MGVVRNHNQGIMIELLLLGFHLSCCCSFRQKSKPDTTLPQTDEANRQMYERTLYMTLHLVVILHYCFYLLNSAYT
jgi:hypothetical protein